MSVAECLSAVQHIHYDADVHDAHTTSASILRKRPAQYHAPFATSSPPLLPDAEVRILFRIGDPDDWREIRSSRLESGGWRRVAAGGGDWETDATRFTDFETQSAPVLLLTSLTCCVPPEGVLFSFCQLRLTLTGHGRLIKSEKSLTRSIRQSHKPFSLFLSLSLSLSLSLLRRPGTIISTHRFVVNISKRREQHQQQQQHFHSIPESSGAKFHGGASQCRFIPGSMDGSIFLARGKTIKT